MDEMANKLRDDAENDWSLTGTWWLIRLAVVGFPLVYLIDNKLGPWWWLAYFVWTYEFARLGFTRAMRVTAWIGLVVGFLFWAELKDPSTGSFLTAVAVLVVCKLYHDSIERSEAHLAQKANERQ